MALSDIVLLSCFVQGARALSAHDKTLVRGCGSAHLLWIFEHADLRFEWIRLEQMETAMYVVIRKFNHISSVAEAPAGLKAASANFSSKLRGSRATMCSMQATGSAAL